MAPLIPAAATLATPPAQAKNCPLSAQFASPCAVLPGSPRPDCRVGSAAFFPGAGVCLVVNLRQMLKIEVGVDLSRRNILVTQKFLHRA